MSERYTQEILDRVQNKATSWNWKRHEYSNPLNGYVWSVALFTDLGQAVLEFSHFPKDNTFLLQIKDKVTDQSRKIWITLGSELLPLTTTIWNEVSKKFPNKNDPWDGLFQEDML